MVNRPQALLLDELPDALDQVQVRRVPRQVQQRDPQRLRHPRPPFWWPAVRRPGVAGPPAAGRGDRPQQGADRLGVQVRVVRHPDQLVGDRGDRPEHVGALAPRRRPDEQPCHAPHPAQEGRVDEVGAVHEVHVPAVRARLGQYRLQFPREELPLLAGVVRRRGSGRNRDGGHPARLQPQAAQEPADLRGTAADAGPLLDRVLRVFDRARRVLAEVLLQGGAVAVQGAALAFPRVAADGVQAAGQELAEVALDGGAGDAGQAGDVVVGQPLGLEPEDFQLALHERLGVVLALERNGRQVVRGEGDARHGRFLAWLQLLFGHRSTQAEVAGKCLKLCRREYNAPVVNQNTVEVTTSYTPAGDWKPQDGAKALTWLLPAKGGRFVTDSYSDLQAANTWFKKWEGVANGSYTLIAQLGIVNSTSGAKIAICTKGQTVQVGGV